MLKRQYLKKENTGDFSKACRDQVKELSMVLTWNNLSNNINMVKLDYDPKNKINIHVLDNKYPM